MNAMKTMKLLGGIALVMILAGTVLAQDEESKIGVWQNDVDLGVNILQSSYSNNWNGGEKGSVVWTGNFNAKFENQFSELTNWRNTMKLAYGQTHQQDRDANNQLYWKKPDKTDDIIDLESLFRWTPKSRWDPFVSLTFLSKFDDVSDAAGRSQNFNPMTLKESAGISRPWIDTEDRKLMSRLGIAFIQNRRSFFVEEAPSTVTVSESSNEVAAEFITEYKVGALDGRVDWESKLTLTLPFVYSGKKKFEDDVDLVAEGLPEDIANYATTVDFDWENTFTASITKVISVKLFLRWVYDKYDNTVSPVLNDDGALANAADVHNAIRKAGQFKQTLALGFTYKFM
jgi:Protein of unknown function (DUF3078)